VSDERDSAGSEGTEDAGIEDAAGQTAVVTRPLRPTGKRTRRAATAPVEDAEPSEADAEAAEGDDEPAAKTSKTAKAGKTGNLIAIDGDDHYLSKSSTGIEFFRQLESFLAANLK